MLVTSVTELQDALRLGSITVSELWNYKAKNWVTSVCAADIDNDGDIEIIAGSRDGRVCALTRRGDVRWNRVVGYKEWVGVVTCLPPLAERAARIMAGTRDGKIYALAKDGKTVGPDGQLYTLKRDGRALEPQREHAAAWLQSAQVIRQMAVTPSAPFKLIAGSEDRCVYALDYATGEQLWSFSTHGWVRAIVCADLDGDGEAEILVGSADKHLYILNQAGNCIAERDIKRQIHTLVVCDLDQDGRNEILLGTDGKDLLALSSELNELWDRTFESRFLSLCIADIDKDGHDEIIASSDDKHLYILDQQGHILWRHRLGYRIFSLFALDFDHDGQIEVLAGSDDERVYALRIHLIKTLDKKIRRYYHALGKPSFSALTQLTPVERELLQDILKEEGKAHVLPRQVNLAHANDLLDAGQYVQALELLLLLQQQKVELLWRKEKVGHIRSLYFGDIAGDPKREIVLGTAEGTIQAFNVAGRSLWSIPLDAPVLSTQTGYVDHSKWQEIIVCSANHHVYVISGTKKQIKRAPFIDTWMSSIYVNAPGRQSSAEIIVSSEDKKLYIYGSKLDAPLTTIDTPQGIKIVHAYEAHEPGVPEIIAGSIENTVYAYTRAGELLWEYRTLDRVRAICIKDIDGDDKIEIIVASESRNVYVLDYHGHLKWRYYLPHRVLTVDALDIDYNGKIEVLLGCGDGYMYVLSRDGDLLWTYQANDRVRVVRAEDIDDDKQVEIALASEDQLELLRVVNQQQVQQMLTRCWLALQGPAPAGELIKELLHNNNPLVRAFTLHKLSANQQLSTRDFALLEEFVNDRAVEVRATLVRAVMLSYTANPAQARQILNQLSMAPERAIRLAIVENISFLIASDWEAGLEYLERLSHNIDRFVRRAVVRKLHQLIDIPHEHFQEAMLSMLLKAAQYKESDWVCQEAARALAHFLDQHHGELLTYLYDCVMREIKPSILEHVAHNAVTAVVQQTFGAVAALLSGLDEQNVEKCIERAMRAFEETRSLKYGLETWLVYEELRRLFSIRTVAEIAHYQCGLEPGQSQENEHFLTAYRICDRLSSITRILRIFLRREDLNDRLTSLLEVGPAIGAARKFLEREYATLWRGYPLAPLPEHHIFELLLKRWENIVRAQLSELRGKAELKAELQTRRVYLERRIAIWLVITNTGRSAANNVKVTLLHSPDFEVVGRSSFESEAIFSHEEIQAEFIIQPCASCSALNLVFEVVYDDAEAAIKILTVGERLELQVIQQSFRNIPNPYSTGTPTLDSRMFFGREDDITFLRDNLARATGKTVIVLYGQRRSGKTTLLRHLINSSVLDEHIPILIDMQQHAYGISVSKFLHNVAYEIYKRMGKRGIEIARPQRADFLEDPTFTFNQFLEDVEVKIQGKKLILLIDEFEVMEDLVAAGKLEPEIFGYLRSLMQHSQPLDFLLSGTHKIEQLTKGYWSVFFNIARHYRLSRLSARSATELIVKPVDGYLEYEPYAVSKIRQLTGDQPYLIHLVCRSLIEHCNDLQKSYVSINDVNVVLREVMQTGHYHFSWIWEQTTTQERILLAALAEGGRDEGRALSLSDIEELYRSFRLPFKREDVLASLKELLDADVIEMQVDDAQNRAAEGARYRLPVGLIRTWLRQEKSLEYVLRDKI
ncbi:hypothetical protein EPA93_32240 [Ktedonosporobacter rubrisoli]|uniref:Uncharacterized protein n=1 Tax=Ktedonosporobacter rubrisoli TaxID=2509675 RepID=A0A4P6JY50_KTERU|nr:PQQ-binding-like beta-propeller repeat protein [Ktedonosporobacter rubrisoli]QBD80392.1 hypothetical protein EPA93_32240 [Ktedonosporobacter rubrisoli]